MKKEYILLIDSGIGGLSTLAEFIKNIKTNYLYFADNAHCPYGNHTKNEIIHYLKDAIISLSKKYYFKIVVIACNTATASAIENLRENFPNITFIGIEPALKLSYDKGYKKILSIATPLTLKQDKYIKLTSKFNIKIKSYACKNLAKNIENYCIDNSIYKKYLLLKEIYQIKKLSKYYNCIVLGCTHYSIIKNMIINHTKKIIIDGNAGVSKKLLKSLSKNDMENKNYKV